MLAYLNPEGSTYTTEIDTLLQIQQDITKFCNKGKGILMGDLNGHTQTQHDFNSFDSENDPIPLPLNYSADANLERRNHDTRPADNRGKDILDLCKFSGMRIINGRKLGDTNGKFTCYSKNAYIPSVIDYLIVDKTLFSDINYFRVDSLTTLSDHCRIYFRLKADFYYETNRNNENTQMNPLPKRYIWNENSSNAFR